MLVGTSGWSYPAWVGSFYPLGTSAARMLPYYAQRFRTVEAHNTHRRRPTAAGLLRWVAQVPEGFRFAPKAHMGITHRRDTDGIGDRVAEFYRSLAPLGDRLGPVLYVLPHRRPDLDRLDALLGALPDQSGAVLELAPAWRVPAVLDRLRDRSVSLALVDRDGEDDPNAGAGAGWSDALDTGPVVYVRLRRAAYSPSDLAAWARRLALAAAGGRAVHVYFKHDDQGAGPRYAQDLVTRLEEP